MAKLPDTLARYPAAFFREGNAMKKTGNLQGRKRNERITAYLFIAPAVVLLIAFLVVPMIYTAYFSVFKYQIMRPDNIDFIGIDNYTKFRTMYFSPQLTSMVVIAVLWSVLYNANPNTGLINSLLVNIGLKPINFLTNEHTAMNAIIFMSAWQGAGYQMMIFLAGLQGIPRDQYEAASVDGATKWNQFRYITLPGLRGTIKYVIMITMIQAMKLFTQPYIMTQGGPKNATKTLVYYIYTQGFQKGNFGYACSIATVFFVIVVTMSLTMKRITTAND